MKTKKIFLLISIFWIFIIQNICALENKELILPDVIINSTYHEQSKLPGIKHQFKLIQPDKLKEPYLPIFQINSYHLSQEIPQNFEFNWMNKSSFWRNLAPLFKGEEGKYLLGVALYREGQIKKAAKVFNELNLTGKIFQENALLYLGWIKLKSNQKQKADFLTNQLINSKNSLVLREAYYLKSYLEFNRADYLKAAQLIEKYLKRTGSSNADFRMKYLYTLSLAKAAKWKRALRFSYQLLKDQSYSPEYLNILRLNGILNFYLGQYGRAETSFKAALKIAPNDQKLLYMLSWNSYLRKDYKSTLDTISKITLQPKLKGEFTYLKFSTLLKSKNWELSKNYYSKLAIKSPYLQYADYQLLNSKETATKLKKLYKKAESQKYNFQELNAYLALLKGNRFFQKQNYLKAEAAYLSAMAAFPSNPDYWAIEYNLALNHLKSGKFQESIDIFNQLFDSQHKLNQDLIRYHIIYALYQEGEFYPLLAYKRQDTYSILNQKQQSEIYLIRGAAHLINKNYKDAKKELSIPWNKFKDIQAAEFLVITDYQAGNFNEVLNFTKLHNLSSQVIERYKIKSLLALNKYEAAEKELVKLDMREDRNIRVKIEVFQSRQKNRKIIKEIQPQMKKNLTQEQRLYYYLSLGDAYFNLKEYQISKSKFYLASRLPTNKEQKDLIKYNLILTTLLYEDYPLFEKQSHSTLKKELSPETRFNITQLLAGHYKNFKRNTEAINLLSDYIKKYDFHKTATNLDLANLYKTEKKYNQCFLQTRTPVVKESDFQRRDRVIIAAECGLESKKSEESLKLVETEYQKNKPQYRQDELELLLAKILTDKKKYQKSTDYLLKLKSKKDLAPAIKLEVDYLNAHNNLKLGNLNKSLKNIEKVNRFRSIGKYKEALLLKAEALITQNKKAAAIKTLLRISYLKSTQKVEKQKIFLKIANLYLEQSEHQKARVLIKRVSPELIRGDKEAIKSYDMIMKKLSQ